MLLFHSCLYYLLGGWEPLDTQICTSWFIIGREYMRFDCHVFFSKNKYINRVYALSFLVILSSLNLFIKLRVSTYIRISKDLVRN